MNLFEMTSVDATTGRKQDNLLEDDSYNASLIGVVVKRLNKYKSEEKENKIIFLFQVQTEEDGKEVTKVIESWPYTISLFEGSNLWKVLKAWTKCNTPQELIDAHGVEGKFSPTQFIGKAARVEVIVRSKNNHENNIVDSIKPARSSHEDMKPVVEQIPDYFISNAVDYQLAYGFDELLKPKVPDFTEEAPKAKTPKVTDDDGEDKLPF